MNPKAELWWAVAEDRGETMHLHLSEDRAWDNAGNLNREVGWERYTVEPVSVVRDGGTMAKEKG